MLKKIIAAAICGIAVASMSNHADAAGAAGFARGFAAVEKSAVTQIGVSARGGFDGCVLSAGQCVSTIAAPLTVERRKELLRVNRDVNATMGALDDYFSGFATDVPATPSLSLGNCGDCAAIKRTALAGAGWSSSALRLAFSLNNDGSLEKVLIVTTDKGDIVLGNAAFFRQSAKPRSDLSFEHRKDLRSDAPFFHACQTTPVFLILLVQEAGDFFRSATAMPASAMMRATI